MIQSIKIKLAFLLSIALSIILFSCDGDSSGDDSRIEGMRYRVRLVRPVDEKEWIEVKGTQEWWFFGGGVFRQISSEYVEPLFFGETQACNGSGSGSYETNETEKRRVDIHLNYDGTIDFGGLCRMSNRTLNATLQPSGAVDLVDGKLVQRLERLESL